MPVLVLFAFISGIVTILSPCILPVLPIVLSGSVGGRRRPVGVILGFIASFSLFTLVLSAIVRALQIPPGILRTAAIVMIFGFGIVMTVPYLQERFEAFASRLTSGTSSGDQKSGLLGGILIGVSLGIVWTPCVGPIIASVISLAVSQSVDGGSVLIILSYSIGTAIPMFGIMIGGKKLIQRVPRLTESMPKIQKVFGVLMIIVALSMVFSLDRRFQAALLNAFPGWGKGLTALEDSDSVRQALKQRSGSSNVRGSENVFTYDNQPEKGRLQDYGQAPGIVTEGMWINSMPLTMEELLGKVVIIDFWTYSCINCVRTIPHLQAWYEAYKDEGLVIIGVHTPEFAFERDQKNVQNAVNDLGVTWPVVLDNEYTQWRAYNNRYWPAKFFIDAEGNIRYFHFGEGEYDTSEEVIRKLLKEAGQSPDSKAEKVAAAKHQSRTKETYLGYKRTRNFLNLDETVKDMEGDYSLIQPEENGEWSIDGSWSIASEYIEPLEPGTLELTFHAKDVFLVIEPVIDNGTSPGTLRVFLDGKSSVNTPDVENGMLAPDKSRVYQLIDLDEPGLHTLKIETQPGLRFFAFTFG